MTISRGLVGVIIANSSSIGFGIKPERMAVGYSIFNIT